MQYAGFDQQYTKLKDRMDTYNKYAKPRFLLEKSAIYFIAIWLFTLWLFLFLRIDVYIYLIILYLAYFGIVFFGSQILKRKERKYRLTDKELTMFYTCEILKNLENYFDPHILNNVDLRKDYRQKAIKNAEELFSTIKRNWIVGNFELGNTMLGNTISKLKMNFSTRFMPNLKNGDESFLKNIEDIAYNFLYFLQHPTMERLGKINEMIGSRLGELSEKPRFGKNPFPWLAQTLREHKMVRHAFVLIGISFLSYLIYFMGVTYVGASNEGSFIASVGLWGLLFIGYIDYVVKEAK